MESFDIYRNFFTVYIEMPDLTSVAHFFHFLPDEISELIFTNTILQIK